MNIKNSSPKISVIVPVYNAEKYINQCVDSILNQGFTDFELLLINDGSKDKSGEICDDYAKRDQRVNVFHKENGGVSSARNVGLDHAQGEYIVFIDSDDYVDKDYLTLLMSLSADFVVTGVQTFGNNNSEIHKSYADSLYEDNQIADCLTLVLADLVMRSLCPKLFRTSIIKENSIYFDPAITYGEDTVFIQSYLVHCHTIAFKSGMPYHYRICGGSILRYGISADKYIYTLRTMVDTYEKLTQHFGFTCSAYINETYKLMLMQYLRGVSKNAFTLNGYNTYRNTMKEYCPLGVLFKDKIYAICYQLLQKKYYFFSYFILKFIYPLKLWIKGYSALK